MAHWMQTHRLGFSSLFALGLAVGLCRGAGAQAAPRWEMGKPIVTYWAGPMPITETDAQRMAEGNWNLVWVTSRGAPRGVNVADHYRAQLDILQRHGLRGILSLGVWDVNDAAKTTEVAAIVEGVRGHPALYAYSLKDEPNPSLFAQLAASKAFLLEKDPSRLVYVNLYPNYASAKQLGGDVEPIHTAAYEAHVSEFIKVFQPQLLSYDHYHFAVKGDGDKYFLNLAQMRQAAQGAGVPFMVIVQACSWTVNMRIPSGEELRWLANTTLAYGAQGISHYVYGYRGHDGAMMNLADGSPTSLYYAAREINKEFVAIATELQPLKSIVVYHAGMTPEGTTALPEDAPFRFDPPVAAKDYTPLGPVEGLVVGYFGTGDKPTHAFVVNLDYRTYAGRGQPRQAEFIKPVKRFLTGPARLEVFDPLKATWTPAEADRVELRLPPSGGVLVRLAGK